MTAGRMINAVLAGAGGAATAFGSESISARRVRDCARIVIGCCLHVFSMHRFDTC